MFKNSDELISKFVGTDEDKKTDYLKRENSNFVYSLSLLRKNLNNREEEAYLMNHILPKKLVDLYHDGVVYVHDKQLSSYCQSVGCRDVALHGVPTLAKNMIASKPTKKIHKFLRHLSNLVVLMSQQVSGAVMLSQMSTICASYLYYGDKHGLHISDEELEEEMQSLIWELNMPLRSGSESALI